LANKSLSSLFRVMQEIDLSPIKEAVSGK